MNDFFLTHERLAFDYFLEQSDAETGLVKDRAGNFASDPTTVASIAATGFGLAALAVGAEAGWISREGAQERVLRTLYTFRDRMPQHHGWYYHFVDARTGERVWQCELSSIDTALFLVGAVVAGQSFDSPEIRRLTDELYRRTDFQWMLTDGGAKPDAKTLCHGWKPETGFLANRWDSYCEHMILYLLAIGSPTFPIPADCWTAWERPIGEYAGYETFVVGPLFVHQFSHAFADFRGKRDLLGQDYWQSSVNATLGNRQFCMDNAAKFRTYGANCWGLSACDGPDGYRAYGAPPGFSEHDGTVAPLATLASVVFAPDLVLSAAEWMKATYADKIWGRYGFCDAFNVDRDWWDADVIGIDVGAALLMLENHRTGFVWERFMESPYIREAMNATFVP